MIIKRQVAIGALVMGLALLTTPLRAPNAPALQDPLYLTILTDQMTFGGKPAQFPACEVSGTFFGFNWKDQGFIVLSTQPFAGALRVGELTGRKLRFQIGTVGAFELHTKEHYPKPVHLWALLDTSFKKGKSFACYASIKNPFECESSQRTAAQPRTEEEQIQAEIQGNRAEIERNQAEIQAITEKGSATPVAHCTPCCTGKCCGVNPDGTCWASDT